MACKKTACSCHEHDHKETCSCHEHEHKETCSCHEHEHKENCSCHEHEHKETCSCHEHKHEHGCSRSHSHSHSHFGEGHTCACGCEHSHTLNTRGTLIKIACSLLLALLSYFIMNKVSFGIGVAVMAAGYLISSYDIIYDAAKGIFKGHFLDENFLMTVASVGAFILGEYFEALAVLILFKIGEMFEEYAEDRSRRSIEALASLKEDTARVIRDGKEETVPADEVSAGETVCVYPGERIAFDGRVIDGVSSVDTSAITGEAAPRDVFPGSDVYSGFINASARITVEVVSPASVSTVSRILKLVESASEKKSKHESFIRRFAKVYTPTVVILAILLAVLPIFFGAKPSVSIYRALSFLVVSCPCALVVSVPLAIFCGIGKASRSGILIKGGSALEVLSDAKIAVFDKTGTLTEGRFSVSEIVTGKDEDYILSLAASAEGASTHPIALSILSEAKKRGIAPERADEIREIAGTGVFARIGDKDVMVGRGSTVVGRPETLVSVTVDGREEGYILLSDTLKEGASEAISAIKRVGIERCIILTGDREESAVDVGARVGADEVRHSLLPEEKATELEKLKGELSGKGKIIFTGDGINDAPVLACADVGVSVGDFASDAAIEASDVVLLGADRGSCDIRKLEKAIKIAKKTVSIVKANVFGSIIIKVAVLALCSFGLLGMWAAIFADVGVLILAVLNSLRV